MVKVQLFQTSHFSGIKKFQLQNSFQPWLSRKHQSSHFRALNSYTFNTFKWPNNPSLGAQNG